MNIDLKVIVNINNRKREVFKFMSNLFLNAHDE